MIGGLLRTQAWEQVAREAEYNPGKMAALCAISERQLERVFHEHLKCTPRQWLRELQCRMGKELMSRGYSSKAAAAEAKFSSSSHFCREFKKLYGRTPKHFAPNHVNYLKITVLDERASMPPPNGIRKRRPVRVAVKVA